jgi:hypothetical protein
MEISLLDVSQEEASSLKKIINYLGSVVFHDQRLQLFLPLAAILQPVQKSQ